MFRLPFLSAGPRMIWLTSYFEVLQETVAGMIREHSQGDRSFRFVDGSDYLRPLIHVWSNESSDTRTEILY